MSTMIEICRAADVAVGTVRRFEVKGQALAVYNIAGVFYATEDRCSHGDASLAEGILEGETIECDLHFGAFHVPTGQPTAPPCAVAIRTFAAELRDGAVWVAV